MIRVQNLTKSFTYEGKRVIILDDITFTIPNGQSVAILGRNGAGKSTLLRLLGGIDLPDSGTIETDVSISWPVGGTSGFQGSLSARENVAFVSRIYASKEEIAERIRFVEEFSELGEYFDRPFRTYSKGMRARVAFGLSMAFPFDVYLIDEVTGAGDQRFREKSMRILMDKKANSDFLMVDHNLWGLKLHCDRAFVLEKGKIFEFDDVEEALQVHTDLLLPRHGAKSKSPPTQSAAELSSAAREQVPEDPAL